MFICQVENINERKIQIVNHIKLQTSKVICVLKRTQRKKQEVIFRGVPKQLLPVEQSGQLQRMRRSLPPAIHRE